MIHHLNDWSMAETPDNPVPREMDDFRFAVIEAGPGAWADRNTVWHWHEDVEFACVVDGIVECHSPGNKLTLNAGEGCFIPSGLPHMVRPAPGAHEGHMRIIRFDVGLLSNVRSVAERYIAPIQNKSGLAALPLWPTDDTSKTILNALADVFDIASAEPRAFELNIMALLYRIWTNLFLIFQTASDDAGFDNDIPVARLKVMLDHIHAHYSSPMSVAELSAAAGVSEREVYRIFRQLLSTTPTLYLQHYRIHTAARLLRETKRKIEEISLDTGFSSITYFDKAFKDLMGVSPRQFRKLQGVKDE